VLPEQPPHALQHGRVVVDQKDGFTVWFEQGSLAFRLWAQI
jgi:hypothetical protein